MKGSTVVPMSGLIPDNFVLDATLIRAAMACRASNDPREHLQYILLDEGGYLNATNGHIAFRGALKDDDWLRDSRRVLLHIHQKIPAWAEQVQFEWSSDKEGMARCVDPGGKKRDALIAFESIDEAEHSTYPDLKGVIPSKPPKGAKRIAMGCGILASSAKAFGSGTDVILELRGVEGAVVAIPIGYWEQYDAVMLMMPVRMFEADDDEGPIATAGDNEV